MPLPFIKMHLSVFSWTHAHAPEHAHANERKLVYQNERTLECHVLQPYDTQGCSAPYCDVTIVMWLRYKITTYAE